MSEQFEVKFLSYGRQPKCRPNPCLIPLDHEAFGEPGSPFVWARVTDKGRPRQ